MKWSISKILFQRTLDLKGMHFLLAEDNELNSEIVTELLKAEGATCDVAVNGQLAAETLYFFACKDIHRCSYGRYDACDERL